jgi:hypothetical protein
MRGDEATGKPVKFRIFLAFFGGQISRCGIIWAGKFSTGIDFREFRNNLQDFKENLYPRGV